MPDLTGQRIGNYDILGKLGTGGMATVYRARQVNLSREVAVKVIKSDFADSPDFIRRFEREAQTIAALDHPHILKVFDYGQHDDLIYLVMELKTGGALDHVIRQKSLSLEQTAQLLDQIAPALDYAHRLGIVHRDLKPQNILLDTNHNAFLTDFGIAKLLGGTNTVLTQSGVAMGTPAYMAPEQWSGRGIDGRTDIYALGVMLYEMLTGVLPFTADTPMTLMYMHLNERLPSLRATHPEIPVTVEHVIGRAAAKDPDQRFSSAVELAAAFRSALTGQALPPGKARAKRRPEPDTTPGPAMASTTPASPAQSSRTLIDMPPTVTTPKRPLSIRVLVGGIIVLVVLVIGGFIGLSSLTKPNPTPGLTQAAAVVAATDAQATRNAIASYTATFTPTSTSTPTNTQTVPPSTAPTIVLPGLPTTASSTNALPRTSIPVTEFLIPTSNGHPWGITNGPDGNLWFTEYYGNKIGRITPTGTITEFPTPTNPSYPVGITSGPDGNLWFTEANGNKIGRITPTGTIAEFPVPSGAGSGPWDITSGADGNLWFVEGGTGGNKIGRITPTGVITEFPLPTSQSYPHSITSGPDGNLWFTEYNSNQIGRITPTGTITEFTPSTSSSGLWSITSGADGNLWFTESKRNNIGRISPAGTITEFSLPSSGNPSGITSGSDGNLWFAESGDNNIGRITPAGAIMEFPLRSSSGGSTSIVEGLDGRLWFTEPGDNKIGRLAEPVLASR